MGERNIPVFDAGDISKAVKHLRRGVFHGERGDDIDDPDAEPRISVGISRQYPKITVRADPSGATLNVTSVRLDLTLDELEELIPALQEVRDYLEVHGKDN